MRKIIYILFTFTCLQLASCIRNSDKDERTEKEDSILRVTEDSVYNMTPNALKMINKGLRDAKDSLTYYDYYLQLSKFVAMQTQTSTTKYADKVICFAKKQKETPRINGLLATAYSIKSSNLYIYQKNTDESIKLAKQAYQLLMKSDNKDYTPDLLANLADVYISKNNIPEASYYYRRALFLVDSLKLPSEKNVSLYMGLAHIYQILGDNKQAERYYYETEKHFHCLKPNMKVYYLSNAGSFYYYDEDYHKSLYFFLRMERILSERGMKGSFDDYLGKLDLADIYLNLGEVNKAILYLNQCEPYFKKIKAKDCIYYANSIRIGIAVKQKDIKKASDILKKGTVKSPSLREIVEIRNKYIRKLYELSGNYEGAYKSLKKSISIEDSIAKERQYMRASEIMMRFTEDTLSLHKKIEIQQKDITVRKTENAFWLSISIIIILILGIGFWLVYFRKIRLQNDIKIMQLKLLNARNRISPHFIFNVLNNKITSTNKQEADELMMLVKLIRANLDISRNTYISLKEELEFVRYYINIEKYILGDDFEFILKVPDDLVMSEITIPSMFIQILAENAIKHGLKCKEGKKTLEINVSHNNNGIDIIVKDNGIGFDIRRSNNSGTKTGLDIITRTFAIYNRRIKHDKYKFDIHNLIDDHGKIVGCKNILHIPNIRNIK